jgi:hypothetical protein
MSAQTFGLHLAERRDHGLTFADSWRARHGENDNTVVPFPVWPKIPLHELTADDLAWWLIQAATDPKSTHLELRYDHPRFAEPLDRKYADRLNYELDTWGFGVMEICGEPDLDTSEFCIRFSLFSKDEFERFKGRI